MTTPKIDPQVVALQAPMTLDEAIAHAQAMLDRAEEANRHARHAEERVRDAASADRIESLNDASSSRMWGAVTSAVGDAATAAVSVAAGDVTELNARSMALTQGIRGATKAVEGVFARFASDAEGAAAAQEALSHRAASSVQDRQDDARAVDKSQEKLLDAFAQLERARAEARIAASRG